MAFSLFFCQILVRIVQMLLLGVSSMGGSLPISTKHRTVLKTCQRPGKRNTGTAVKRFSQNRKTGTLLSSPEHVQNIKTIVGACCLLNFSFSACVREGAKPLKSSRKYEPLTQGNGLNPNHDGSSTERDVPKQSSHVKHATTDTTTTTTNNHHKRTHTTPTNHSQGSANGPHSFCLFIPANMAE